MYKTLVTVDTLKTYLHDPHWMIFDCRFQLDNPAWGRGEYDQSHVPGAMYAHLDDDLAAPKTGTTGRHPLPDPDDFVQWLGEHGVDADKQVVAYDQDGGMYASRLWWMLRWLGHESAAVLNGGWAAWNAAGYPVSDERVEAKPATFKARVRDDLWLTSDQLVSALEANQVRLIDARGAPRFRGETEPLDPVAGHVPGAVNLPFMGSLDERGHFKDAQALKERFESVIGDAPASQVVHMCGSGVTACHSLLAMEVAGLEDSRIYPGSWSEWITDPERPVETGE